MTRRIKGMNLSNKTYPIKDPKKIQELLFFMLNRIDKSKSDIKKYQAYRNYMIVLIGINTAFRAEDLLQLRVSDVIKGYVTIIENKTGKPQNFRMNSELHKDILGYIERYNLGSYDYLFLGQKKIVDGKSYIYPITRQQGHKIVSEAAKAVGIEFVFGMHSLRKTFGYQYISNGGNILTLMKMYNHADVFETQAYVLWGKEDAEKDRENIYIGKKMRMKKW
ncbi:MAG: tyrosine-type recombinase/integrase [Erysipelotrichaceae bacterium]|nr:tyrosine-type recombinase/integrase [Erysipelotrichaceae bacterium]